MEIHVRIDSQSYGPYDLQQVHDLMANGQLKGNDPAWCDGMADWSTLDLVLAQMDPDNAPAPSEFAAPPKVDCPKCGAAMNPTDVSCYKCGFQPGLRGKDSRHKRPLEPHREEMQRQQMLSRIGWALLVAALLPAILGNVANPKVVLPNFQLENLPGWMMFLLLSPVIVGAVVVASASFIPSPYRGVVVLLMAGVLFIPVVSAEPGGSFPKALEFMDGWLASVAAGIPLAGVLLGVGWTLLLGAARWRSFAPGSLAAYLLALVGGAVVMLAWVLPLLPESQGGTLSAAVIKLFSTRLWLAIVLSIAMLFHAGAVLFCVFSTRGKVTLSIVSMNRYAVHLLVGSVIVPVLTAVGVETYGALQVDSQWMVVSLNVLGQLLLAAKVGLWLGGAFLLPPMALGDLCAGRVEELKTGRRIE